MKAERIKYPGQHERRIIWAAVRASLEAGKHKYKRSGKKSRSHWSSFEKLLSVFKWGLKISGLYEKGIKNAAEVRTEHVNLY